MKNISLEKVKPQIRIILEIAFAIIIAVVIEFGMNYPSLTKSYEAVLFSNSAEVNEDGDLVYSQNMDKAVYVNKLKIKAETLEKNSYTVVATVVNDFGKTKSVEITDKAYPEFGYAYTNVREKVSKLQVIFTSPEKINVSEISYSNKANFNGYRMAFFALVIFLGLILIFEREIYLKKVQIFYLIFALGFGSLIIMASGPVSTTWDEEVHYNSIYTLNFHQKVNWNEASKLNCTREAPVANTREELKMLNKYMNNISNNALKQQKPVGLINKGYIVYLPMIVSYHICEAIGLPYTMQYTIGRFGNLIFCALLNCFVIYVARRKKLLVATLALMPTLLFQASLYTNDGVIFACMNLGFVLWMNLMDDTNNDKETTWKQIAIVAVLLGIGCIAKPVYFPVMILMVPILWKMIKDRVKESANGKRTIVLIAVAVIAVCMVMALISMRHVIINLLHGNSGYGGDTRGGNTGIIGQLVSIIKHPIAFIKMFIHEIFTFDNFRNFGDKTKNQFLPSNLMFLNLYGLGMLKDAWSFVLLPVLAMLFLTNTDDEQNEPKNIKTIRVVNGIAVVCSVALVWIAMYLAFTPIGADAIEGVQARYFIPLLLPAAYTLWNNRIQIKVSKQRYYQIVLGAALVLAGVCFYQTLICGRLI